MTVQNFIDSVYFLFCSHACAIVGMTAIILAVFTLVCTYTQTAWCQMDQLDIPVYSYIERHGCLNIIHFNSMQEEATKDKHHADSICMVDSPEFIPN